MAITTFWTIALLALPQVRKKHYEIFQMGHLLMFPLVSPSFLLLIPPQHQITTPSPNQIILLILHGSDKLLENPHIGYWIGPGAILLFLERSWRHFVCGFRPYRTRPDALADGITRLTIFSRNGSNWNYEAGQYVLVHIREISVFEWHPFTVSACHGNRLCLHIKAQEKGSWTRKLLMKAQTCTSLGVCLDGPFGAPAQQFYNYDHSIVIGSGIGITPFSAILNHMQTSYNDDLDPWQESKRSSRARKSASSLVRVSMVPSRDASPSSIAYRGRSDSTSTIDKEEEGEEEGEDSTTTTQQLELDAALPSTNRHFFSSRRRFIPSHSRSRPGGISGSEHLLPPLPSHHHRHRSLSPSASSCDENEDSNSPENSEKSPPSPRTVHFHWLVRSQNNLQWFSNLLNRAIALRIPGLDLQVHTYITSSPSSSSSHSASSKMSTHVFRYLLDSYRAPESPYSALTGLIQPSRFGRPDMEGILEKHFRELCERNERSEYSEHRERSRSRSRSERRSRSHSHSHSHSQNDENYEFPKKDNKKKKLLVGVFFCGAPALGLVLRDKCRELTTRGYSGGVGGSGVKVKYEFRMEVFG